MEPVNNDNIDARLAALTMSLELLSADRETDKEKIRSLFTLAELGIEQANKQTVLIEKIEAQSVKDKALMKETRAIAKENSLTLKEILRAIAQDAENIRDLARLAAKHESRLARVEGVN